MSPETIRQLTPPAQPPPQTRSASRRARIDKGLCVDCGRPRHSDDPAKIRALRLAEVMGARAPYPQPRPPTATRCSACAGKHHAATVARRDKAAAEKWGNPDLQPRRRQPDTQPLNGVTTLRIPLNQVTLDALTELRRRDRDAAFAAGKPHPAGQVSRLVRDALRRWRQKSGGYRPGATWFCLRGLNLHFRIDAETLAIVDREAAQHFAGSRSATIRAMLIATANPPITATIGGHRQPGGSE